MSSPTKVSRTVGEDVQFSCSHAGLIVSTSVVSGPDRLAVKDWGINFAGLRGRKKGRQTLEDDAKGALADLLADTVVHADDVCGGGGRVLGGHRLAGREGGGGEQD